MFHYPHERDANPSSPTSAERWARLEAKSDAMVDDVLAASGAATSNAARNPVVRRWQLAAFAFVVLSAFVLIIASVIFSIPTPGTESSSLREHVASSDDDQSHDQHSPRYWGPFRP